MQLWKPKRENSRKRIVAKSTLHTNDITSPNSNSDAETNLNQLLKA